MSYVPILNSNITTASGVFHVQTEVVVKESSFCVDVSIYMDGVTVDHHTIDLSLNEKISSAARFIHEKAKNAVALKHKMFKRCYSER